ncbi:hypothetical protein [Kitasatospora sp. NPDC059327]|uniref:hypothetical protein n=1 Tax=Kitasatospora sp. NPDC059327 TaxID=3346803 RepID=UPI00368AA800
MIETRPVLETPGRDAFALWPVGDYLPHGFLALNATMSTADGGTADGGTTVRLTPGTSAGGGRAIELPLAELRRLLAGTERDLTGFRRPGGTLAARQLPGHRRPLVAALARTPALAEES